MINLEVADMVLINPEVVLLEEVLEEVVSVVINQEAVDLAAADLEVVAFQKAEAKVDLADPIQEIKRVKGFQAENQVLVNQNQEREEVRAEVLEKNINSRLKWK